MNKFLTQIVLGVISIVSGFFRALGWRACRFYPTCSCYAKEAFAEKDFFTASRLSVWRVLRCHPFSAGGYEPLTHVIPSEAIANSGDDKNLD